MHIRFSRRIVPALAIALIGSGLYLVPSTAQAANVSVIDTTNKAAVTRAYRDVYLPTLDVPVDWNGSAPSCNAGAPSAAAKDAIFTAFNYMRAMAGLSSLSENLAESSAVQQAALMMQANRTLDHSRDSSWLCYTEEGARTFPAIGGGEIIAPVGNAKAIPMYMLDAGSFNQVMGHRATILEAHASAIGVGSTAGYNAIHWIHTWDSTSNLSYWGWPSKGYFPYELLQQTADRWSFYPASGDASRASVSVAKNGVALSIPARYPTKNPADPEMAQTGLGWDMPSFTSPAAGATDTYKVTISGISGGNATTVTYDVLVYSAMPVSVTISFNANCGSTPVASKAATYMGTYGDLPVPTRSGYAFQGWFTERTGGAKVVASSQVKLPTSRSLFAQWKARDYTITFNANGGTTATPSKTVTFGNTYGALPTPTRSGYAFNGWFTAASGGTRVIASSRVTYPGSRVLYAQWKSNQHTITFNANGGTTATSSKTVTYLGTYGALPVPTRSGYTFNGWFTAASGGTKVVSTSQVRYDGSRTLYAQWQSNQYKITFSANGGTVTTASKTVTYLETYGALPTPTRSGYTFQGWFTDASGGTKVLSTSQVQYPGSRTLYAQWKSANLPLKAECKDGTFSYQDDPSGQDYSGMCSGHGGIKEKLGRVP